jgi:hypothetical protein
MYGPSPPVKPFQKESVTRGPSYFGAPVLVVAFFESEEQEASSAALPTPREPTKSDLRLRDAFRTLESFIFSLFYIGGDLIVQEFHGIY